MLSENDQEAALAMMMQASDETMMNAIDLEILRTFPSIETGELVALWRQSGKQKLDEAEALIEALADRRKILEALQSAQAALNPLSGFLRKGSPKTERHLEATRNKIRSAIDRLSEGW